MRAHEVKRNKGLRVTYITVPRCGPNLAMGAVAFMSRVTDPEPTDKENRIQIRTSSKLESTVRKKLDPTDKNNWIRIRPSR